MSFGEKKRREKIAKIQQNQSEYIKEGRDNEKKGIEKVNRCKEEDEGQQRT